MGRAGAARGAPQPTFGIGVLAVILTGLAAAGFAGFAIVAELLDDGDAVSPRVLAAPTGEVEDADDLEDTDAADALVASNDFYDTGEIQSVDCPRPDVDPHDRESMERFLDSLADCMDKSWEDQFAETQEFQPPVRHFWTAEGQGPCGRYPAPNTAAFYCEMNQGLYLGLDDIVASSQDSEDWEAYAMLLSHEYAHHVQNQAGILRGYRALRAQEDDDEDGDALTRRSELQANCLGGAFLGAERVEFDIDEDSQDSLLEDVRARADSENADRRTHGTVDNGELWIHHGFDRRDPAACNTWQARDELVE